MSTVEIGEDEFDATYKPIIGPDDSEWREWRDVPEETPVEKVWTVVDGDDGRYFILPGYHMVNFVARIITEKPWSDELLTVRVDSFEGS